MSINDLKIIFIDINSLSKSNNNENSLDNSLQIIEQFVNNHITIDYEKNEDNDSYKSYTFIYQILPGKTINSKLKILIDLDGLNDQKILLDVDSYIIFFNLEDKTVLKKFPNIITYIQDNLNLDVIVFFVGLYMNENKKLYNNKNIDSVLKKKKIKYEYKEICLAPNASKVVVENSQDKNSLSCTQIEKLFIDLYNFKKEKTNTINGNAISIKKNDKKNNNEANSKCIIF